MTTAVFGAPKGRKPSFHDSAGAAAALVGQRFFILVRSSWSFRRCRSCGIKGTFCRLTGWCGPFCGSS